MILNCKGQERSEKVKENLKTFVEEKTELKPIDFIKNLSELRSVTDTTKTYVETKKAIIERKRLLKNATVTKDSLAIAFKQALVHEIFPFWEGTVWSFEGHTSVPKKGEIACGYFVSTTLKHIGVNVNRYKLAQQSPINEAKSLALNSKVINVEEGSLEENILKIKESIPEGIHFIGFDQSHVGYILKEKDELYIIHSNYMGNNGVEIERVENSIVFSSFERYHIVILSTNEAFLKSWIAGNELKIIH